MKESCMKKLNELSIRCCPKLKKVPAELLKQMSFKELILNNMPPKFKELAEKEKGQHVSVIVKDFDEKYFEPLLVSVSSPFTSLIPLFIISMIVG